MHKENQQLLQILNECANECSHCAVACLDEQDVKAMARCIKLDIDCTELCRLTASFISRGSEQAHHIIKACIEMCEACAAECEKHKADHCKRCAEVCRRCAEACKKGAAGSRAA